MIKLVLYKKPMHSAGSGGVPGLSCEISTYSAAIWRVSTGFCQFRKNIGQFGVAVNAISTMYQEVIVIDKARCIDKW